MYLTEAEEQVLGVMRNEPRWWIPVELAHETGLHVQAVRGALKELTARRLIERGGLGASGRWGDWRITDHGQAELRGRDQLKLV